MNVFFLSFIIFFIFRYPDINPDLKKIYVLSFIWISATRKKNAGNKLVWISGSWLQTQMFWSAT